MATTLFFRYANADQTGGNPTPGVHTARTQNSLAGTNDPYSPMALTTTRGIQTVGTSLSQNTVTGPTNGVELKDSLVSGGNGEWISPPLAAGVTIAGTITAVLWSAENSMSANVAINVVVDQMGPDGTITQIAKSARVTENPTSRAPQSFTVTPTSTAFAKGDRIRVRIFGDDAGTMASGFTFDVSMGRSSAGVDGDSSIQFTETLTFQTSQPTGDTLYLTSTAGPSVGAQVEKEMWTSRGGGSTTCVTNSVAGPVPAGSQLTDSAGGAAIEWYSRPLQAFTLADMVMVNLDSIFVGNQTLGVGLRMEIAVCDGDGSNPVVWASQAIVDADAPGGLWSSSAGTTGQAGWLISAFGGSTRGYLTGPDTAVTDGQRLRLRLLLCDAADAVMQTGTTATMQYNGTSAGAAGDSWIKLSTTVAEFVVASPTPIAPLYPPGRLSPAAFTNLWTFRQGELAPSITTFATVQVGAAPSAAGATASSSATANAAVGVATAAPTARPEPSATARALVGPAAYAGSARPEVSTTAIAELGALTAAAGALLEVTKTAVVQVGVAPSAAGATSGLNLTVNAAVLIGAATLAGGARPDAIATALAAVGTLVTSAARPEPNATAVAQIGVQARAGGALLEITKSGLVLVGAATSSSTARPDATAIASVLVGVIDASATARPEPSATATALVGAIARAAGALLEVTKSGLVLVGVTTSAQPVASGDLVVNAVAAVGALLRSQPLVATSTAATALLGVQPQGGTDRPDIATTAVAELGALGQAGAARPEMSSSSRTYAASSAPAAGARPEVSTTARTSVGAGASAAGTTITTSSQSRTWVGVLLTATVSAGAPTPIPGPIILWREPPAIAWREPIGETWTEPPVAAWREPIGETFTDPTILGNEGQTST